MRFWLSGNHCFEATDLNCEDLRPDMECLRKMSWAKCIPSDVVPCSLRIQVRTEFSGTLTPEFALKSAVSEYNARIARDGTGLKPIHVEFISSADWCNASQRVAANNFPNCCRFKDIFDKAAHFETLARTVLLLPKLCQTGHHERRSRCYA